MILTSFFNPYFIPIINRTQVNRAFREASEEAMKIAGHVVTVRDGEVGKLFDNGEWEVIEKIERPKNNKISRFVEERTA